MGWPKRKMKNQKKKKWKKVSLGCRSSTQKENEKTKQKNKKNVTKNERTSLPPREK